MGKDLITLGIWALALALIAGGGLLAMRHGVAVDLILEDPSNAPSVMGELLASVCVSLSGLALVLFVWLFRNDLRKQKEAALVFGVLGIGWLAVEGVMATAEHAERVQPEPVYPLVEALRVESSSVEVSVEGYGTVEAMVRAEVAPQVSGRVVGLHANMVAGGFVRAGEVLIEIDPQEYRLAVDQAKANVAQAVSDREVALRRLDESRTRLKDVGEDLERTEGLLASGVANEREVEKAQVAMDIAQAQLNGAESGLASAEARLASTRSTLEIAELRLERTEVRLPFDAVVVNERVDEGQYLNAGQQVGAVYGTEAVEVPIPLEDRDLGWLEVIPLAHKVSSGVLSEGELPRVRVLGEFGGRACEWEGRAVRLVGEVDPVTRMVTLVVRVNGAFEEGKPPLMPGSFTRVVIKGKTLTGVFDLPRLALRDGAEHGLGAAEAVYVVSDDVLRVREVQVVRKAGDRVFVGEGLREGEVVVLSPMEVVSDGMRVRLPEELTVGAGKTVEASIGGPGAPRGGGS
ncbi:MAG: efflux RND transporter periplasmic adaptor subunit [Planctomycetota bacterium]|jgi:RND family efflux transporter MFP subunit